MMFFKKPKYKPMPKTILKKIEVRLIGREPHNYLYFEYPIECDQSHNIDHISDDLSIFNKYGDLVKRMKWQAGYTVEFSLIYEQETADPDADGPKEKQGNIAEATGGVKE